MDVHAHLYVVALVCVSALSLPQVLGADLCNVVHTVDGSLVQKKLISGIVPPFRSLKSNSLFMCLQECHYTATCQHVNFLGSNDTCKLYNVISTPFEAAAGDWEYVPIGALTWGASDACTSVTCSVGQVCVISQGAGQCVTYVN